MDAGALLEVGGYDHPILRRRCSHPVLLSLVSPHRCDLHFDGSRSRAFDDLTSCSPARLFEQCWEVASTRLTSCDSCPLLSCCCCAIACARRGAPLLFSCAFWRTSSRASCTGKVGIFQSTTLLLMSLLRCMASLVPGLFPCKTGLKQSPGVWTARIKTTS